MKALATWTVRCFIPLCAVALSVPFPVQAGGDDDDGDSDHERTISVSGVGTASVKPNLVRTSIGLNIASPTFGEAMRRHRETMSGILEVLSTLEVEEKDILTDNFSFRYRPPWKRDGEWTEGEYQINNVVRVFIRDIDKVDQILESVVESGANQIHGLEFLVEDTSQAESRAREKAAANARSKAEELARLHGVKLGDVIRVNEISSGGPVPVRLERELSASVESAITSPGERTVASRLSVVYSIR